MAHFDTTHTSGSISAISSAQVSLRLLLTDEDDENINGEGGPEYQDRLQPNTRPSRFKTQISQLYEKETAEA